MLAIEAEVAPPCITGHFPAEFVSCPLMFISCPVCWQIIGAWGRNDPLRDEHRYFQMRALIQATIQVSTGEISM
jgi:hypothetical protein